MIFEKQALLLPGWVVLGSLSVTLGIVFPQIEICSYKGVSYAQRFPDSHKIDEDQSPLGWLQVYSSSYFHFAPGLSDTAGFNLKKMPENAYVGMYMDGDGPVGIMKHLLESEKEYLDYLPMSMPYLLESHPQVLVMQFGGGISTEIALHKQASRVTVAEGNFMVLNALNRSPLKEFTGDVLHQPRLRLIPSEGRWFVATTDEKFDLIDLSLADSTGLSMPGGLSITEKYLYTEETLESAMKALAPEGILSLTVWNKEDPPKSTLRVLSTLIEAAGRLQPVSSLRNQFFITHTYLSTLTVLYKKNGFSPEEYATLKNYCQKMSFEQLHPQDKPLTDEDEVFQAYRQVYFAPTTDASSSSTDANLSMGHLYSLILNDLFVGKFKEANEKYVFDFTPLTNDHPYLSGFVKFPDLPYFLMHLENISDEWGYLLLWVSLGVAVFLGCLILIIPLSTQWRSFFSRPSGKRGVVPYFICLGLGYILVELGLMSKYLLCLPHPTISISVLIAGMLFFSGLGSLASEMWVKNRKRGVMVACCGVALGLVFQIFSLNSIFQLIGSASYVQRILVCLVLLAPLAFCMGFPFSLGMSTLSHSHRDHLFVWAWGINGSFSVVGSMLAPLISVLFGLSFVLVLALLFYLLALGFYFFFAMPQEG